MPGDRGSYPGDGMGPPAGPTSLPRPAVTGTASGGLPYFFKALSTISRRIAKCSSFLPVRT